MKNEFGNWTIRKWTFINKKVHLVNNVLKLGEVLIKHESCMFDEWTVFLNGILKYAEENGKNLMKKEWKKNI